MNSEILVQLKESMSTTVALDYTLGHQKFNEISTEMTTFTRNVHEYFFSVYSKEFAKDISKSISRIMECTDEVLITAAINKLAIKLPKPSVAGFDSDYYSELAKLTIAGIIWHSLIDTKAIEYKRETKRVDGKWQTLTHLFLGGSVIKDVMKGLHFKPGVTFQKKCEGFTLMSEHKKRLKRLSSIPFELSDIASHELIMKGYELKEDWFKRVDKNGKRLHEHHTSKVDRYTGYADLIMGLEGTQFYLELKYSGSGRMFYKFQLEGVRPQGKLWETLMIDSAKAYMVTEEQQSALKHHIYCAINEVRVTPAEAVEKWDEDYLSVAMDTDPMTALNDEEFGEMLLLKKAGVALSYSMQGLPTKYMFGWDFTTSGLIVAGMSFHSKEMMRSGNVHTEDVVHDAHTDFNELLDLGLGRKEAKKIHQPLLHGGTWKGLLDTVHESTGDDSLTLDELSTRLHNVYGSCVNNIVDIADWGTQAVSSKQSTLSWTLFDGFRATHKSYFQSVHNKITVVSCDEDHKKGITSHTVVKDMPIAFDSTGKPLTLSSVDASGNIVPANVKIRGLYANITHSGDAYVLRNVVDAVLDSGMPIKLKHDDYMIHPSSYNLIHSIAQKGFSKLYESNIYQLGMQEIAFNSTQRGCIAPTLIQGSATNVITESNAFLMP